MTSAETMTGATPSSPNMCSACLIPAEHERVGRLIETSQALRAERDFWVSRFAALNAEFEETPVPGHLSVGHRGARLSATSSSQRAPSASGTSLLVWRGIAAGALAVAVVAVGFNLMQPRADADALATQLVAALQSQEGSDVEFVALLRWQRQGAAHLAVGRAVPDKDFELWDIQGGNSRGFDGRGPGQ